MRFSGRLLERAGAADIYTGRNGMQPDGGLRGHTPFLDIPFTVQMSAPPRGRTADTVNVSSQTKETEVKCPCHVGKYDDIQPSCKSVCGPTAQAHHIVPDKFLGLGNRTQRMAGDRLPVPLESKPLPSFGDGPAICLNGNAGNQNTEHNQAHKADAQVNDEGARSHVPGTLGLGRVMELTMSAAIAARPDCANQIKNEVGNAFKGVNPNTPLRATDRPPKPGSPAHMLLKPEKHF